MKRAAEQVARVHAALYAFGSDVLARCSPALQRLRARLPSAADWRLRAAPMIHLSFWAAAAFVGIGAVLFARLIELVQTNYLRLYAAHPVWALAAMPLLFLGAAALVVKLAPEAKGSGIPQVLVAIEHASKTNDMSGVSALVSLRTAAVKTLSTTLAVLGGASIGREGPTVQLASSAFAQIGMIARRYMPQIQMQSYLVAGAAGGVAAAFNTPLAGVAFALEEIAEDVFGQFKQFVMVSVIIAGVAAQALAGNYLYFGRPKTTDPSATIALVAIVIGLVGGFVGGWFGRLLASPPRLLAHQTWWARALACGVACALLAWWSHGATIGSGYEITREFMEGRRATLPNTLAPAKLAATVFSYLSGMAGGIFAPSLSIGAGVGTSVGTLFGVANLRTCALIGMVAFFTGTVQAPLTAIIIVTEMTDKHVLILPLMAAALVANGVSKRIMPTSLYRRLARATTHPEAPPP
ncbi:MAG: chloride channel protein [Deltaproteobacteria bacterium]|nr:chloride channel protein [Deltaproteobacteria bacterium]